VCNLRGITDRRPLEFLENTESAHESVPNGDGIAALGVVFE
jgi:hypothetical protein